MRNPSTQASRAPADSGTSIRFPASPENVRVARDFVIERLGGPVPEAALIVSELVSNSIVHGPADGTVTVAVTSRGPGKVRIEVTDLGSGQVPEVRDGEDFGEGGHGLRIVAHLAERWGHYRTSDGGLVTWAELAGELRRPTGRPRLRLVRAGLMEAS